MSSNRNALFRFIFYRYMFNKMNILINSIVIG